MSTPSLPRLLAAIAIALVAVAWPAVASTSLSPAEVFADTDVTLTLRTTTDTLDPTVEVTATFPEALTPLACGAPDGWSCSLGPNQAVWSRGTSLASDDTFTLAVHTPVEPGVLDVTLTDTRTSGASESSEALLNVLPPEPEPTESSPEPTPTPTPTVTPTQQEPDVALTPFRPPNGASDDPISISDLPSEPDNGNDPVAERVISSGGLTAQTVLAGIVAALLALSGLGFFVARANR